MSGINFTFSDEVRRSAAALWAFEAAASLPNTGTGERREGEQFEKKVSEFWAAVATELVVHADGVHYATAPNGRRVWVRIAFGRRAIWLPTDELNSLGDGGLLRNRAQWLDLHFDVSDLISGFPGTASAIERYSPDAGSYAGDAYPNQFSGLSTRFDDQVLLEENGVLKTKFLLEYKSAKSSRGVQLDGNAHERLSFQIMQYLEVATRYTKCSLVVMANGAFAKYRNKYHVNFHTQADRLRAFCWFDMRFICTQSEYMRFADELALWLLNDASRESPLS